MGGTCRSAGIVTFKKWIDDALVRLVPERSHTRRVGLALPRARRRTAESETSRRGESHRRSASPRHEALMPSELGTQPPPTPSACSHPARTLTAA